MLIYVAFLNCVLLKKMVFAVFFCSSSSLKQWLFFFFFLNAEPLQYVIIEVQDIFQEILHFFPFFIQIHLPLLSSYTLIGIHQSRQSAGNVKSNVNNINVDNDIISQTFRTSVRFLKRNNDDNKTVNGTYSRLYSSKLFMSQFKYQAPECASNRNNRKRSQKVECAPSSGWIRWAELLVVKNHRSAGCACWLASYYHFVV